MSVKQITQISCDRCGKLIETTADGQTARVQVPTPLIYAEGTLLDDDQKIHFEDLCLKCTTRVESLCAQIRLDDAPKEETPKGGDEKLKSVDNPPAASTQKPKPTKT